jgi:hypothetical protein
MRYITTQISLTDIPAAYSWQARYDYISGL